MFFLDAWFNSKKSEALWLIWTRAVLAAVLLACIIANLAVLIFSIGDNVTFIQSTEQSPNNNGIPIPGIHLCSSSYTLGLADFTYVSNQNQSPNGTIALTCMLETMGSNMTDCTQWLRPAAPLILSDNLASYISCYHLQIPQTPENAWYAEYVNTTATQNFIKNVWLAALPPRDFEDAETNVLYAIFTDGRYDPYVPSYNLPTNDKSTTIHPKDLNAFFINGNFEQVQRNNYIMGLHYDRFIEAWFHRFLTRRNLVNRDLLMTSRNYLGWPMTDEIATVDVWVSDWLRLNVSAGTWRKILFLTVDTYTETVHTEIRVHTVLSAISSLGGFINIITGIYVFLFGVRAVSSWGVVQAWAFGPGKKSMQEKINDTFSTSTGIPLVDRTNWRITDQKPDIGLLAERLQAMEDLMDEYFVNANYLRSMRMEAERKEFRRRATRNHLEDNDSTIGIMLENGSE